MKETGLDEVDWSDERKRRYVEDHDHGWSVHLPNLAEYAARAAEGARGG